MKEEDILQSMSNLKNKFVRQYIAQYLGHEPVQEELRRFTIMHELRESRIFFRGQLIGHLRYHPRNKTILTEYLPVD